MHRFLQGKVWQEQKNTYLKNDGYSLKGIGDYSVSLIYSFDSMVHFDNEVVQNYLKEIYRVLKPGSRGFIHHSNYVGNPGGNFMENPHCRNFMSKELFAHYCIRAGMNIIEQKPLDWELPALDCLTVFEKPLLP